MASGLLPYIIKDIPENIEIENNTFASKLIKSFNTRSKQKGILYNYSFCDEMLRNQHLAANFIYLYSVFICLITFKS